MFGKRPQGNETQRPQAPAPAMRALAEAPRPQPVQQKPMPTANSAFTAVKEAAIPSPPVAPVAPQTVAEGRRSESFYETKGQIFGALIEAIDLTQLSKLEPLAAREEIRDIVNEIIAIKNVVMSISEQEELLEDICNDVLGYGPLEPLLARDDIADIMVNGAGTVYIEVTTFASAS
jgi:pilus assembly protein CpaF